MERRVRLGDVIDDYCTRCRRLMNHGIVGMVGDDVAKVRCNTCQSEHAYKHGRLPKRRRGETDRLFAEVLRGIRGEPDPSEQDAGQEDRAAAAPETGDGDRDDVPAPRAASRRAARDEDGESDETAGDADEADGDADASAGPDGTPDEAAVPVEPEDHPAHGVRRRLFTIRRHSGGKAPVEGVSTDIGRPGGPVTGNRPGGPGGGRGGRPQPGAQGGHGGGRWSRRRGRRR